MYSILIRNSIPYVNTPKVLAVCCVGVAHCVRVSTCLASTEETKFPYVNTPLSRIVAEAGEHSQLFFIVISFITDVADTSYYFCVSVYIRFYASKDVKCLTKALKHYFNSFTFLRGIDTFANHV